MEENTEDQLTLLLGGSPAKTSQQPGSVGGFKLIDQDYSLSSLVLLAKYNPSMQSWRTSQTSLVETEDDGLEPFSEPWPRSGTMRNGTAYLLPPLVQITKGTESGLLPTPTAQDNNQVRGKGKAAGKRGTTLGGFARMLPTPTAQRYGTQKGKSKGASYRPSLETMAKRSLWPTPCAGDSRGAGPNQNTVTLGREVKRQNGGQLNPTWVEWLMGYPAGWTELDPLAMQSYRKSRKSSEK